EQEAMAVTLAESRRKAAIQRLGRANRVGNVAEIREDSVRIRVANRIRAGRRGQSCRAGVGVGEPGEVHALGHREVQVSREVSDDLLFVADVRRVDAWVRVVAAEHRDTRLEWELAWREKRDRHGTGISRRWTAGRILSAQ